MLKVAIADDENIVRVGLQAFIDWEANGFELAGLFNNGLEVLEYCKNNPLDILITDIKMPVMDGSDLIKNIKKIIPDISIVVLSNYDDFQLVSNSFKEGISDYVLKQFIEPEKLLEVLNSIKSRIHKKSSVRHVGNNPDSSREKKEDFLRSLLFSKSSDSGKTSAEIEALHLNIKAPNLYCLFMKLCTLEDNQVTTYKKIDQLAFNICTVISETTGRYCESEYLVVDQSSIALILSFPDASDLWSVLKKLEDLTNDLYETLISIFNIRVYFGCSKNHGSVRELPEAYKEASEAVEDSFFNPECKLFHYTSPGYTNLFIDKIKFKKNIHAALKYGDYESLQKTISQLFEPENQAFSMSPENFKQLIIEAIDDINFYLIETYGKNIQSLLPDESLQYVQTVLDSASIEPLREYLNSMLQSLFKIAGSSSNSLSFVMTAKDFIHKNYMNNIGLSDISKHLGFNSSYLCRLFKEKTGENLSNYITRLRIEKSIELMAKNLSTDEIAEKVGYYNTNYFIKVFKKVTGKTISEFKSKMP